MEGGVYLDVKTILKEPIRDIFPADQLTVTKGFVGFQGYHIGVIAAPPKHPVIGKMVEFIVSRNPIAYKLNYHLNCVVAEIYARQHPKNVKLLHENCNTSSLCKVTKGKDRYGRCCIIVDDNKDTVFHSRDTNYPYR